ncbi:MAG TPA: MTH938/NDUFAF3 family protein [Devosiaceae bacterium]|nr:MTH938/NDUFAF3 family protein [Devosiaceae bacterium]
MPDEMPKGRYPYQVPVDAYGSGGFRFAGMSHRGSLLCLPTGMEAWRISDPGEVTLESLAPVLAVADRIDVLFIGLGPDIAALDPAIRAAFRERQVIVEAVATRSAVTTYNVLLAEQRPIAAALLAVERAR